jgi:hypothetical protein
MTVHAHGVDEAERRAERELRRRAMLRKWGKRAGPLVIALLVAAWLTHNVFGY